MASFGINQVVGKTFAALAVSAFAMTTLDTATRLARFAFQEFFENITEAGEVVASSNPVAKFFSNRYVASVITVIISIVLAFTSWKPYAYIWCG
ncbi:carbon starvation CstA family protein [Thermoanaerobacter thermocopriae]